MDELSSNPDRILDERGDESYLDIFHPLNQFVDESGQSSYRLIRPLRDAAVTKDPVQILARAAEAFFFAAARADTIMDIEAAVARGNAFADLAVTGRDVYSAFRQPLDLAALDLGTRALLAAEDPAPTDAEVAAAIGKALDRAYAVAWALRGPVSLRAALRAPLGWIAVSGEDDKPHRQVNVPPPPYEQFEIPVDCGGLTLRTCFFIASTDQAHAAPMAPSPRSPPPDFTPGVPADHEVILFLHGHSSGADEAVEIIPKLLKEGVERGKKYSIVSFDLPNNGYSQAFDHTSIAPTEASTYPQLPSDSGPIAVPILDFIEDFVVAFVDALDAVTPIKNRIAAIIGGSLGGNLAVRLGRRDATKGITTPWLRDSVIVAWSPASVWTPKVQHTIDYKAPNTCFDRCREGEGIGARASYFYQVYEEKQLEGIIQPQPEYWYRRDWGMKPMHVNQSALGRFEIYNANYRRWHWRVAGEQLIYSHFDNEVHGDTGTAIRYELNTVRMLLVAGSEDNYIGTHIYRNTALMGRAMGATKGRLLLVGHTGHSIHYERPRYFAKEILKFLTARSMRITCVKQENGRVVSVGGTNMADNAAFRMSEAECIHAIRKGDEFFVVDANGNRSRVIIATRMSRPYFGDPGGKNLGYHLKTVADASVANNLESLPDCPDM